MYMYQMIHYKEKKIVRLQSVFQILILIGKNLHMRHSDYNICIDSNDHIFAVVDYLLC